MKPPVPLLNCCIDQGVYKQNMWSAKAWNLHKDIISVVEEPQTVLYAYGVFIYLSSNMTQLS